MTPTNSAYKNANFWFSFRIMECRVIVPEECYHIKNRSKKKETMESSCEPKINKQGSQVLEGVFGESFG